MTDPLYDEPTYLTELPEDLKLKRAAAARRGGGLVGGGPPPPKAGRAQFRRRFSEPVRERLHSAGEARLAWRAEPAGARLGVAGRRRSPDGRRGLGAGLEVDLEPRLDRPRPGHAGARGGGFAADPGAAPRRPRTQLLLSPRSLQHHGD